MEPDNSNSARRDGGRARVRRYAPPRKHTRICILTGWHVRLLAHENSRLVVVSLLRRVCQDLPLSVRALAIRRHLWARDVLDLLSKRPRQRSRGGHLLARARRDKGLLSDVLLPRRLLLAHPSLRRRHVELAVKESGKLHDRALGGWRGAKLCLAFAVSVPPFALACRVEREGGGVRGRGGGGGGGGGVRGGKREREREQESKRDGERLAIEQPPP